MDRLADEPFNCAVGQPVGWARPGIRLCEEIDFGRARSRQTKPVPSGNSCQMPGGVCGWFGVGWGGGGNSLATYTHLVPAGKCWYACRSFDFVARQNLL